MPTIQSARSRQSAALYSAAYSVDGFRWANPSRIAFSSMLDSHRREKGFFAARLLVHQTENQFALAPCVRCTDDTVHIRAVHQLLQDAKLLFGAGRHQILPLLRQDGQVCDAPLDVLGVVDVGAVPALPNARCTN